MNQPPWKAKGLKKKKNKLNMTKRSISKMNGYGNKMNGYGNKRS